MLRERLTKVEKELKQEKKMHRENVATLNADIELWMSKYEIDTTVLRSDFISLVSFTDIEREIN